MKEKYIDWNPLEILDHTFDINKVIIENGEVTITLKQDQCPNPKIAEIHFEHYVTCRIIDFFYTLGNNKKKKIIYNNNPNKRLAIIVNSKHIEKLKISSDQSITPKHIHYAIWDEDETLEIVSEAKPSAKLIS